MGTSAVYAALTRLYPAEFRREYGSDLVQHFDDLASDRGRLAAWARTSLDLAITVPRYRLESIMNPKHSSAVLNLGIAVLIIAGLAVLSGGFAIGLALVAIGAMLVMTQRSRLAQALRTADTDRRRRRLRQAGVLAAISVITLGVFLIDIGDDEDWGARAFAYNYVFYASALSAIILLIVGLLTPRNANPASHGSARLT